MKEKSPFTDALYDHHFDIDTLLVAFCVPTESYLNTHSGDISSDGETGSHSFLIEPLPNSFITELQNHPKRNALNEVDNAALTTFLSTAQMADCPAFFEVENNGFAAGWLRERIKDVVLEWLDMNGLIPPSMRHVRDSSAFATVPNNAKIKIELN